MITEIINVILILVPWFGRNDLYFENNMKCIILINLVDALFSIIIILTALLMMY